jgi:hypothetical protein
MKSMYTSIDVDDIIKHISKMKGRLFLYEHYLSWFKDYFNHYMRTTYLLLHEEGFIPLTWRYYIAIMSVSTMRCEYLLKVLEENFLEAGGDESWLIHGLDVVPEKLARLGRINNMIAHQPWIILPDDINVKICLKKEININKIQKDSTYWNINELVQAILIMVQFHKYALICESLHIHFVTLCEEVEECKLDDVHVDINIKEKLLKNLEIINQEENGYVKQPRKSCDFSEIDLVDLKQILEEGKAYNKHIHSFCSVYHDFDPHSEEYRSYLVNMTI